SQRTLPVRRSRQMVSSFSPRAAVRKMRSRVSAGDECPNGSSVFQTTFFSGPNSEGRRVLVDTPDPFGPRKRDQPSGSGMSAASVASASMIANMNLSRRIHRSRDGGPHMSGMSRRQLLFSLPALALAPRALQTPWPVAVAAQGRTPPIRVRTLNHFGLAVSDAKRSVDFY